MTWPDFLSSLESHRQICLVGPMASNRPIDHLPTIFVDGGIHYLGPHQPKIFVHVGDGDSSPITPDHLLPAEKDHSDLAWAMAHLPASIVSLDLYGFLGGRRDHEYINMGESYGFLSKRSRPTQLRFWSPNGVSIAGFSAGRWTYSHQGLFSLVSLRPTQVLLTGDCQYKIDPSRKIDILSSLGLSNQASGEFVIDCDAPVFLFFEP